MDAKTMTAEEVEQATQRLREILEAHGLVKDHAGSAQNLVTVLAAQAKRVPGLEADLSATQAKFTGAADACLTLGTQLKDAESERDAARKERDEAKRLAEDQEALVAAWSEALGLAKTAGYNEAEAIREERDAAQKEAKDLAALLDVLRAALACTDDSQIPDAVERLQSSASSLRERVATLENELRVTRETSEARAFSLGQHEEKMLGVATKLVTAEDRVRELEAEKAAAERSVADVLRVGRQMANTCFNLGQEAGPQLTTHVRGLMRDMARQWDASCLGLTSTSPSQPPPTPPEELAKCKDCGVVSGDGGHIVGVCDGCQLEVCGDCTDPTTPDEVRVCADCFARGDYGQPPPAPAQGDSAEEWPGLNHDGEMIAAALSLLHKKGAPTIAKSAQDALGRIEDRFLGLIPPTPPPGLREAVGLLERVVRQAVDENASGDTYNEGWRNGAREVQRRFRAAYDATGGEVQSPLDAVRRAVDAMPVGPDRYALTVALDGLDGKPHPDAEDAAKYRALQERLNTPETENWLRGVRLEAEHQRQRWGESHDTAKEAPDWFWTLGYLAGKAIRPGTASEKQRHHLVAAGALLLNWHRHLLASDMPPSGSGGDASCA